jgi:TIGR03009 family protein
MHSRLIALSLIVAISMTAAASAQQYPPNGGNPQPSGENVQPGSPNQPVQPQLPTLEQRAPREEMQQPDMQPPAPRQPAQAQPPAPPFTLTPQEQAQVEQLLKLWERKNRDIKTFDCKFKRWVYDTVFGRADQARFVELGLIKYASPDRGMFRIDTTDRDGKEMPIDDARAEHWISDGKAIIEFSHVKKQVIVHKLPPELQGKAIADSPLPFMFGSDAQKLKQRYFLRLVPPPDNRDDHICLEAYPRHQQEAANFHHAQFIIDAQRMEPYGLRLVQPNGKDFIVYVFYEIVVNDPLRMFRGDPFRPITPSGWQSIIEEPQGGQARRVPNNGRR